MRNSLLIFTPTARARTFWRVVCLALLLSLIGACQSVNRLREAQDAFNQASTADMRTAFGANATIDETVDTDAVGQWANVRNQYGAALISLNRMNAKDERLLRDEKLWGAKLTLEALCHWKLGNYEKALEVARDAQETDQLFPRDRAVLQALPGLVMTDYAFDLRPEAEAAKREFTASANEKEKLARGKAFTNLVVKIESLTVKADGAVDLIQTGRSPNLIEDTHPAHVYLIQAQLAAYRNFRKGYELMDQTGVKTNHPAHIRAQGQLDELAKRVTGAGGQTLVTRWAELDKLTPPRVGP
ncbi:MAG TPA: hypothetical protein VJS65_14765 [Verrucomicrobiae bacterium]|nr:hypothetical protein [Verrucomicrobiae bacterium]